MLLNATAILAARDRETREVPIPEWEGAILLGVMGALPGAQLLDWLEQQKELPPEVPAEDPQDDEEVTVLTCDSPQGRPEPVEPQTTTAAEDQAPEPKRYNRSVEIEWRLRYLIATILDPVTLLPAFSLADLPKLGAKHPAGLSRAYRAALELNGETPEAAADLEKNLPGAGTGNSGGV